MPLLRRPRFDPFTGRPLNPYTPATTTAATSGPNAPARPTHASDGTPILYLDDGRAADTNIAINDINGAPPTDAQMTDATMTEPTIERPVVGGISILQAELTKTIATAEQLVTHFKEVVRENEETRRIKKATAPPRLKTAADNIAEVVHGERPVSAPTLRNVVRSETDKAIRNLQREVQSLRAKVAKGKQRRSSTAMKSVANTPSHFQRRRGSAAGIGSASKQTRGTPPARGNAATAAESKPKKPRSGNKSAGKGRASANKRRN